MPLTDDSSRGTDFNQRLDDYTSDLLSDVHRDEGFWDLVHDILKVEMPNVWNEMFNREPGSDPDDWLEHLYYMLANEILANVFARALTKNRRFGGR